MKKAKPPATPQKVPGGSNDALSTGKILQGNYFSMGVVSSGCLRKPVQDFDCTNLIGEWGAAAGGKASGEQASVPSRIRPSYGREEATFFPYSLALAMAAGSSIVNSLP